MKYTLYIFITMLSYYSFAQDSRGERKKTAIEKSNTLNIIKHRSSLKRNKDNAKKEFAKKIKEANRRDAKEARLSKKPQYSDPTYLGHKRRPKKRAPGKQKFCKECGLWH